MKKQNPNGEKKELKSTDIIVVSGPETPKGVDQEQIEIRITDSAGKVNSYMIRNSLWRSVERIIDSSTHLPERPTPSAT